MKTALSEQVEGLGCRSQKCRKRNKNNRLLASYWFISYYVLFAFVADALFSSPLFRVLGVCSETYSLVANKGFCHNNMGSFSNNTAEKLDGCKAL